MSRDDEVDYRLMYPIEGRNRKRRPANPRPAKPDVKKTGGFRFDTIKSNPPKDRAEKNRQPDRKHNLGKSYPDDGEARPRRSMLSVAREMLAKDLNIRIGDMIDQLEAMGYEAAPVTISSIRQEMFKVLSLCERHGSIIVPAWRD